MRRTQQLPRPQGLRVVIGLAGLALGGCQINAIDLARTLRERGHAVWVVAVRDDAVSQSILPYARESGIEVEFVEWEGLARTAAALRRVVDAHRADIVHAFAPWLGRVAAVSSAGWTAGAAVETNWNMENAFWGSPYVPLIVGTGGMQEEAESRLRAAVHLMEPPVDLHADHPDPVRGEQFRHELGVGDDQTLLSMVTRVDKAMKSEAILRSISAVERIDDPRLRLVIVGDGDAFELVSHAAEDANARLGRVAVQLTGSLQDPRPAYAGADVVLGMGGSAIRGLAHGKPVVVVGEGGFSLPYEPASLPHFRRHGFYGTERERRSDMDLADQIVGIYADERRREALGGFALQEATERFGLDATADALETIYRAALSNAPGPATRRVVASRLVVKARLESIRARWGRVGRRVRR
nr:glycosyltransferase family 4 protein [Microbacterium ureisolvens]